MYLYTTSKRRKLLYLVLTACLISLFLILSGCSNDESESLVERKRYYRDADGDGFGNAEIMILFSHKPSGYVRDNTDCNDSDSAYNPNETESCDGKDNNCSGAVDEGCVNVTYYMDSDGDTYVDFTDSLTTAPGTQTAGYITDPNYGTADCDDTDATIYPGATEIANDGIDQDCNGVDALSNCTACHTQTEFSTTGHGLNSGTYASGNPNANSGATFADCTTYCHIDTISHNTTNNPYRLTNAAGDTNFNDTTNPRSAKENSICLDCHASDGTNTTQATVNIGTLSDTNRHFLTKHTSTGQSAGGNFCVDCHDPHGDSNDYMIHDKVTKVSDGQYGTPVTQVVVAFPQTSGTYDWDAYVNPTPNFDGLCQVCHDTTTRFKGGTTNGDYDSSHNTGSRCTTCHTHTEGFLEDKTSPICTGCHTQAEFSTTGHGLASGTYASGNPNANSGGTFPDCTTYCHTTTVTHQTAINPYRLINANSDVDMSDPGSARDNAVCLDCHASDGTNTAQAAVNIGALADTNKHYLTKHASTGVTAGGNFCWDCHDPHGDANDYMIQDRVSMTSDGVYGTAATTAAVTFPTVSGTYAWGDYVKDTTYNGICQVCHTTTDRFTSSDYDGTHNAGTRCTNCHIHQEGFQEDITGTVCSDCHTQTQFSTSGHGRQDAVDGPFPSANPAPDLKATFATCTSYCHTSTVAHLTAINPYRLINANSDVDMNDLGSTLDNSVCLDCHASDGTNAANASVHLGALADTNNHYLTKHASTGVTAGGNFCWDCHDPHGDANDYMIQDAVSTSTDGDYGTAAATVAVTFPTVSGTYAWGDYVKDTTYNGICQVCHTTTDRFTSSDYDGTHNTGLRCTQCHSHPDGFEEDISGSGCSTCHSLTVSDFTTTGHGKASGNYASGNPNANSGATFPDCITYCHDSGVAHNTVTNPYRLTNAAGDTDFNDSGSTKDNAVCLDCHTSDGTYTAQATVSVGALADTNTHYLTKHASTGVTAGGNFCWDCHDPHGDNNDYMLQDSVAMTSDGEYGTAATTANVTFPTVSGTYAWGDYVKDTTFNGLCQVCHTTTDQFTNADYDSTHNNTLRCTNCHSHKDGFEEDITGTNCTSCHAVTTAQFTTTGHGLASGTYASGNPNANSGGRFPDCVTYCHTTTVAHNDTDDPYRLIDAASNTDFTDLADPRSDTENLVCLDCHASNGTNTAEATTDVGTLTDSNNHFGTDHVAQTEGGNYCWDCHDPHGDANDYMIQGSVAVTTDGQYGTAATTAAVTFPDVSGTYAWGDYVKDTTYNGLCQVCHDTASYFTTSLFTSGHNSGSRCTACHTHNSGFAAGGGPGTDCTTCHQTGGSAVGSTNNRRSIEVDFSKTYQHGYAWGAGNFDTLDCELCHNLSSHSGGTVQLKVWTDTTTYTSDDFVSTDLTSATASCVSCHGDGSAGQDLQVTNMGQIDTATRWSNTTTGVAYNKYDDGGTNTFPNTVPTLDKAYSPHRVPASNDAKSDMDMAGKLDSRTTNTVACLDCHTAHGSDFASGANATMGTRAVMLDDNSGTYTLEEDVCWGCHDYGMDYYGDGSSGAANWSGTWEESLASYKNGYDFLSSHFYPSKTEAWSGGTSSGTRSTVYCSSCHNVHGISSSDTDPAYRLPILRGTWLTSPYKEDRAPGSVSDITNATWNNDVGNTPDPDGEEFGPLPRATSWKVRSEVEPGGGYLTSQYTGAQYASGFAADRNGYDGYFIDQNTFGVNDASNPALSGYITEPQSQFAGLCLTCHPKNTLQTVGGARSFTGHSAVAWDNIASQVSYTDIFMGASYGGAFTVQTDDKTGGDLLDHNGGSEWNFQWYGGYGMVMTTIYNHKNNDRAYGSREDGSELAGSPDGTGRTPTVNDRRIQETFSYIGSWGLDFADQTNTGGSDPYVQKIFHQFPCSKCHTPHASRLPRLMRTNCLDNGSDASNINETATDYTNDYSLQSTPTAIHTPAGNSYNNIAGNSGSFTNPGPNMMNYEAVNCHSVAGSSSGGWNRITPWKEGTQPVNP